MDAGTLELVELDETAAIEARCESDHHGAGRFGHGGPATHLALGSCIHSTGFRCLGFVEWITAYGNGYCGICGSAGVPVFVPICRSAVTKEGI